MVPDIALTLKGQDLSSSQQAEKRFSSCHHYHQSPDLGSMLSDKNRVCLNKNNMHVSHTRVQTNTNGYQ